MILGIRPILLINPSTAKAIHLKRLMYLNYFLTFFLDNITKI